MNGTAALQYLLLAGFAGILALCCWLFVTRPHRRYHVIAPATWAIFGTLFYGSLVLGILPPGEAVVLLSAVLRLHSVMLVLGGLLIFVWRPNVVDRD